MGIIKLSDPQVFVRFNYDDSYFISYEEWKENIAVVEWLSGERPAESTQEEILTGCWNFLATQEAEEERQAQLREEEEDDDDFE